MQTGSFLDNHITEEINHCIYPIPKQAVYLDGSIALRDLKVIYASNEEERFAADYLCEKLVDKTGFAPEICTDSIHEIPKSSKSGILLRMTNTGENDSFSLDINEDRCIAKALNRRSLLYAADTLLQCLDGDRIKCCHIEDEALLELRGVHFALPSRKDMEFLKKMVKYVFVPMRYNTVFLQISAAMEYENYPEINRAWMKCGEKYENGEWPRPAHYGFVGKDILTKEEVRNLCEYMESFGMEVIPEIQSWGHTQYITMAYPYLAEKQSGEKTQKAVDLSTEDTMPDVFYDHTMCPLHEDYYSVIFGILDEVLDVVKPKRFVHMGHDEIYDIGKCPKCALIPAEDLFAGEVTRLNDHIKSKNLTMMIWADMLQNQKYSIPDALPKVPEDIIMIDFVWYFHMEEDIEDKFLSRGFQVVIGNMYSSHFPRMETRARKKGILGAQVSPWVPCNEFSYGFYGKMYDFVYSSQCLWSGSDTDNKRLIMNELVKPILKDIRQRIGNLSHSGDTKHVDICGEKVNVPYDIRDLVAYDSAVAVTPVCPEAEISVDDYGEIVTFVHSVEEGEQCITWKDPLKIGEYVLVYEDDSEFTENIFYAGNIYKYRSVYGDRILSPIFRHRAYVGTYPAIPECGKTSDGEDFTLGHYSVRNPYPDKRIRAVKIRHEGNVEAGILLFDLILGK